MRHAALATATLLAFALPLTAQQGQQQQHHHGGQDAQDAGAATQAMQGMQKSAGMATSAAAPCPGMLLKLRAELSLTEGQVEALEALKSRTHPEHMALKESASAAKARAETALEAGPDLSAYETALMEAAQADVAGKLLMARAGAEALEILDDDQRTALPELLAAPGGSGKMGDMRCMHGRAGGMKGMQGDRSGG